MITYKKQLQALQEYALDMLKKYPLSRRAVDVLHILAYASEQERITFFELIQDKEIEKIFSQLSLSGSIKQWLENRGVVASDE
jgi:Mg/Co/Ni transporter MgtE